MMLSARWWAKSRAFENEYWLANAVDCDGKGLQAVRSKIDNPGFSSERGRWELI